VFIGHLPAGYLASLPFVDRAPPELRRRAMMTGLVGSVLPDLDLLWFYLVDHRRHVHHAYLPHLPAAWLATLAVTALPAWLSGARGRTWLLPGVFAANVMLHLGLDTIVGGVEWLWPWSDHELVLVEVPPLHQPWFLNFLLHWTFALELVLAVVAVWVFLSRRRGVLIHQD
jgi:inner membrane protein